MPEINIEALEQYKLENERKVLEKQIAKEKKALSKQEAKEPVKPRKNEKMVPWVAGVFINREHEGGILAFSYDKDRFAIKDGEHCEIPEYIADHLNTLKYTEFEWVRDGAEDRVGKKGIKRIKEVKTRCEFRVTRSFERPVGYKIPRPERHRL